MKFKKTVLLSLLSFLIFGTITFSSNNTKSSNVQAADEVVRPVFNYSYTGTYLSNIMAVQCDDYQSPDALSLVYNLSDDSRPYFNYVSTLRKTTSIYTGAPSDLCKINCYTLNAIMLVTSGTNDATKAITDIFCIIVPYADRASTDWVTNPRTTINRKINGYDVTYTAIPCYNYIKNTIFPVCDANDTALGSYNDAPGYVFLYSTTDPRAGKPISKIQITGAKDESIDPEPATPNNYANYRAYWADDTVCDNPANMCWGVEKLSFQGKCFLILNRYDTYSYTYEINFYNQTVASGTHAGYITSSIIESYKILDYTPVDLYYLSDYSGSKAKDGDIIRKNITLYAKIIDIKSAPTETQIDYFVKGCVRMADYDTSRTGSGSGYCKSRDLYIRAKDCYKNLMTKEARGIMNNVYLSVKASGTVDPATENIIYYYALERFVTWAAINGENVDIEADGSFTISSAKSTFSLSSSNDSSSTIVTIVSVLSLITMIAFCIKKTKKEN